MESDNLAIHNKWNEKMAKIHSPDDFITRSSWPVRWVENRRIMKSIETLDCKNNSVVLDIGCGPGNLTQHLIGSEIVGLDPSQTLLDQAQKKMKGRSNVKLILGNGESLPFPNGYFDRIICSEVLEHVFNPDLVIQEMKRVSKPNCQIVITFPNEELINLSKKFFIKTKSLSWIAGEYQMSHNMLDEWHKTEIKKEDLVNLFGKNVKIEDEIGVPLQFIAYHWIVKLKIL